MTQKNIHQYLSNKSNDYSVVEDDFLNKTGKSLLFDHAEIESLSNKETHLTASVVIPAWNAEGTILATLVALEKSSFNLKFPQRLQVVITDDGSTDGTFKTIQNSNLNLNITVVRQENFGQGPAMNASISAAEGDIIVEVDADTVLNYFALENLMVRHESYKNALYTGFRHYVQPNDVRVSFDYLKRSGPDAGFFITNDERFKYFEPGYPSNMCVASDHYKRLGNFNGLWMPDNNDFRDPWLLADMVFGMLFSVPREVLNSVGGFDDRFEGWGCDDGYVGAKVISEGLYVIPTYSATGFHISHPFRTEDRQSEYDFNREFFFEFINSQNYQGHPDWIGKAKTRITELFSHENPIKDQDTIPSIPIKDMTMDEEQLMAVGKYANALEILISNGKDKSLQCAQALFALRQYQESISILEFLARDNTSKDERCDISFQLALCNAALGNFKEAKSQLMFVEKNNGDYPELSYWLHRDPEVTYKQAMKYFEQMHYDIALRCFESVLILTPDHESAIQYRNQCLKKQAI